LVHGVRSPLPRDFGWLVVDGFFSMTTNVISKRSSNRAMARSTGPPPAIKPSMLLNEMSLLLFGFD
jgi:hypothetical protein